MLIESSEDVYKFGTGRFQGRPDLACALISSKSILPTPDIIYWGQDRFEHRIVNMVKTSAEEGVVIDMVQQPTRIWSRG